MSTEPDAFRITLTFDVEGPTLASFRQLEALFERLDRAALLANMALQADALTPSVLRLVRLRRDARRALQRDPNAPRVLELSTGTITVKTVVRDAKRTGAVLLAVGGLFGAADLAAREAQALVRDTAALVSTIEQVARLDTKARSSQTTLRGQGADPPIRLTIIQVDNYNR